MLLTLLINILFVLGILISIALSVLVVSYFRMNAGLHRSVNTAMINALTLAAQRGQLTTPASIFRLGTDGPPVSIELKRTNGCTFEDNHLVSRCDAWLKQRGFVHAGDFIIEPLREEALSIYLSEDKRLIASIRKSIEDETPYVEFCFNLGTSDCLGVSNPPNYTVALPEGAAGKFYAEPIREDLQLLEQMHCDVQDLMKSRYPTVISAAQIPELFENAHAREIEERIRAGGIAEDEIRASLEFRGIPASRDTILEIQHDWQSSIERFLLSQARRIPRSASVASSRVGLGYDHLLAVHEGSSVGYVLTKLKSWLFSMQIPREQLDSLIAELQNMLEIFPVRDTVARFRPLLPPALKYELIEQLSSPCGVDIYVLPAVDVPCDGRIASNKSI